MPVGTRHCRRVVPCPRRAPPARLRSRSVTKPGGRAGVRDVPRQGGPSGQLTRLLPDTSQALLLKDDEGVGSEAQGVPPTAVPQGKTGSWGEPRRRKTGCEKWGDKAHPSTRPEPLGTAREPLVFFATSHLGGGGGGSWKRVTDWLPSRGRGPRALPCDALPSALCRAPSPRSPAGRPAPPPAGSWEPKAPAVRASPAPYWVAPQVGGTEAATARGGRGRRNVRNPCCAAWHHRVANPSFDVPPAKNGHRVIFAP